MNEEGREGALGLEVLAHTRVLAVDLYWVSM